jgi:hypothetical protein
MGDHELRSDGKYYWPKVKYAMWIEDVKKVFKEGDWITANTAPIKSGECPPFYGLVMHINELNYNAPLEKLDAVKNIWEPRALLAVSMHGVQMQLMPGLWRPLTEEEKAVGLFRDKPKFLANRSQ